MKMCMRGGHTEASPGASASINELVEDRKVCKRVIELLSEVGNEVYDVTPPETYVYPAELNYGINETNRINPEVFFSIHFNSFSGAKGSEVCVYPGSQVTSNIGNNILNNLQNLGFVNRGLKQRTDLAELCNIKCESAIIEVCFVQDHDASLYKSLGVEKIARTIANGIDSRVNLSSVEMHRNIVVYNDGAEPDRFCAEYFNMVLNNAKEDCICVSCSEYAKGEKEGRSRFAVGGSLKGKLNYHKIFAGKDRNETAYLIKQHLNRY